MQRAVLLALRVCVTPCPGASAPRSSSQMSGGRSPSPTHGPAAAKEIINPALLCRYLCHAVANMGALETAALEFVRLGVQDSLSSLLERYRN